jgi:ATP-dependent DNA helicase RecG
VAVNNECRRVLPDDLMRLMNDKAAFVWETQVAQQAPHAARFDADRRRRFLEMVRASDRVSDFIKTKTDDEILSYYLFIKDDCLTNLGVLWIGVREDRAKLAYAPAIRCLGIVEEKCNAKDAEKEALAYTPSPALLWSSNEGHILRA